VNGLTVPSEHGGAGLSVSDCVLVLEQLGKHLVPDPVAIGMGVVVPVLKRHAPQVLAADLLPRFAAGTCTVSVQQGWSAWAPWAGEVDIVAIVQPEGLHLVMPKPQDVTVLEGIDSSRRPGRVAQSATRLATLGPEAAEEAWQRAAVVTAALLVGVSHAMIGMAAEYARQRVQFGVPIGVFQGVKHQLADAYVAVEGSRRTAWWALLSLDTGSDDRDEAVSVAKATIGEAARQASYAALQVHGGVGYTWACDLHLWMKRAQALEGAWGSTEEHWQRLQNVYGQSQ
jgi:alkylation response protein AidB-like acyl-CoA dehydrogenase